MRSRKVEESHVLSVSGLEVFKSSSEILSVTLRAKNIDNVLKAFKIPN